MDAFNFNTSASIQFGAGSLARIGALSRERLGGRVLIVTDPGMVATGIVERAKTYLSQADVQFDIFADVVADPPTETVLKAVEAARAIGATGVLGLGGVRLAVPLGHHFVDLALAVRCEQLAVAVVLAAPVLVALQHFPLFPELGEKGVDSGADAP